MQRQHTLVPTVSRYMRDHYWSGDMVGGDAVFNTLVQQIGGHVVSDRIWAAIHNPYTTSMFHVFAPFFMQMIQDG